MVEADAILLWERAVRPLERMNSPLEIRKVRLRGLGGPALCGIPGTCASATEILQIPAFRPAWPAESARDNSANSVDSV
jgi:hypothetical protein